MTRIGIIGSAGRMGQELLHMISTHSGAEMTEVAGAIDVGGDPMALAHVADVLIDFSSPKALMANLSAAVAAGKPLVIGTTGLDTDNHRTIDDAAVHIPVLQTGNTSLGVTLLTSLVEQAARRLGSDWDVEILEMHHMHKRDAPSGTALLLGDAAAAARCIALDGHKAIDRNHKRVRGEIGFASLRGGSVAGDHDVIFAGEGERLILAHRAENRSIFARGAIKAAQWLIGRPAGRYTMKDVLGL